MQQFHFYIFLDLAIIPSLSCLIYSNACGISHSLLLLFEPFCCQGTNCEVNHDECGSGPCLNGAACVDGVAEYTCRCADGYSGEVCETNINDCVNISCAYDGLCIDGVSSYSCQCQPGFTGESNRKPITYAV